MTATLSLLSYNLNDYGKSPESVRQQQHEVLGAQGPDVLCLQEIWDERGDLVDLHRHLATIAATLGMTGMAVPAPRTHCHMAILWRPEILALAQEILDLDMWHGLGAVRLDVGAAVPLRVAVTHLAPWDPDQRLRDARVVEGMVGDPAHATIIAADWNAFGANEVYDREPDWSRLPPRKVWRHASWTDDPDAPLRVDRRATQLLHRSGLRDAAPYLNAPWQPTGGHVSGDMPRRLDAFWTNRPDALLSYEVLHTPQLVGLSDHLPIRVELDPAALAIHHDDGKVSCGTTP
jgi:endonuclease/exonuclease/phosphatase family metal-dependent hydrolase